MGRAAARHLVLEGGQALELLEALAQEACMREGGRGGQSPQQGTHFRDTNRHLTPVLRPPNYSRPGARKRHPQCACRRTADGGVPGGGAVELAAQQLDRGLAVDDCRDPCAQRGRGHPPTAAATARVAPSSGCEIPSSLSLLQIFKHTNMNMNTSRHTNTNTNMQTHKHIGSNTQTRTCT